VDIDAQHPNQAAMKFRVDAVEIGETWLLPKNHFVKAGYKVYVKESLVKHGKA
jgi:hypothetical protein